MAASFRKSYFFFDLCNYWVEFANYIPLINSFLHFDRCSNDLPSKLNYGEFSVPLRSLASIKFRRKLLYEYDITPLRPMIWIFLIELLIKNKMLCFIFKTRPHWSMPNFCNYIYLKGRLSHPVICSFVFLPNS